MWRAAGGPPWARVAPDEVAGPELRILFYSPADLNLIDGSAIWVQAVAETLVQDPRVRIWLPLKSPERRDLITGSLRRLGRVALVDPPRPRTSPRRALSHTRIVDAIEELDRTWSFDIVLIRSFEVCRIAAERPRLRGRLWSAYILEPEREADDGEYVAGMAAISDASRHVVVQSDGMRRRLAALVPASEDRTIILPPAVPPVPAARAPLDRVVPRLVYTGKFHPFYPVPSLVEAFVRLRRDRPDLTFEIAGDKITGPPDDPRYATRLRRLLTSTEGLTWHGALSRTDVEALLARGGIALSVWDYAHGPSMNDLVISTKLLDYCSAGLPVILNRTSAQEELLGADYPLFVAGVDEVSPLVERVLADAALYRAAAERCFAASRAYTYDAVAARLAPYLDAAVAAPA